MVMVLLKESLSAQVTVPYHKKITTSSIRIVIIATVKCMFHLISLCEMSLLNVRLFCLVYYSTQIHNTHYMRSCLRGCLATSEWLNA
ncbi:hypothetical protein Hdeb2414_s0006g00200011 [Helianthus debilis subsp. tardiflorus]